MFGFVAILSKYFASTFGPAVVSASHPNYPLCSSHFEDFVAQLAALPAGDLLGGVVSTDGHSGGFVSAADLKAAFVELLDERDCDPSGLDTSEKAEFFDLAWARAPKQLEYHAGLDSLDPAEVRLTDSGQRIYYTIAEEDL